ncbi:hypothetical protein AALO_G00005360 [Alosa alosa]|uniref:Uncharacterized protein n=1 Tax=Alosa alosa TaxID=278164 RepID=A0AAV6HJ81_9TELE|nr:hypothetical protein AALO_G00005360 [Alosa alosa]
MIPLPHVVFYTSEQRVIGIKDGIIHMAKHQSEQLHPSSSRCLLIPDVQVGMWIHVLSKTP